MLSLGEALSSTALIARWYRENLPMPSKMATQRALWGNGERAALRLRSFPSTIVEPEQLPETHLHHGPGIGRSIPNWPDATQKTPPIQSHEGKVYGQIYTPSQSTAPRRSSYPIYPSWVTAHCSSRGPNNCTKINTTS